MTVDDLRVLWLNSDDGARGIARVLAAKMRYLPQIDVWADEDLAHAWWLEALTRFGQVLTVIPMPPLSMSTQAGG